MSLIPRHFCIKSLHNTVAALFLAVSAYRLVAKTVCYDDGATTRDLSAQS